MSDLISRQAAMVVFENSGLDDDSKDTVVRVLEQLPSAQPETHDKRTETHACDLISRQAAIDAVDVKCLHRGIVKGLQAIIEDLPSAQPERKKARWLDSQGKEKYVRYCAECSACGGWSEYITDFCPNCGADMRGESE